MVAGQGQAVVLAQLQCMVAAVLPAQTQYPCLAAPVESRYPVVCPVDVPPQTVQVGAVQGGMAPPALVLAPAWGAVAGHIEGAVAGNA